MEYRFFLLQYICAANICQYLHLCLQDVLVCVPVFAPFMALRHGKQFLRHQRSPLSIMWIIMIKIYDLSPKILLRPKNLVDSFVTYRVDYHDQICDCSPKS